MRPRIIATVAVSRFPLWRKCLAELPNLCTGICIRFDEKNGDRDIWKFLKGSGQHFFKGKLLKLEKFDRPWVLGRWHEDLLRMADNLHPDIILAPCQDETFHIRFPRELNKFWLSGKSAMMFDFQMRTDDGRDLGYTYPPYPHMRVYRWKPKLTYLPYQGLARVVQYVDKSCHWKARSRINHWCMYTKAMQRKKEAWAEKNWGLEALKQL